jgi:nucleotidyltransferase substrate binding protein (TIGR01987 family)
MQDNLVRCKQRFVNYSKSIKNLETVVDKESLNEIEKAGLVQFFEVSFELAWKLMKDYLIAQGYDVKSPREAIKTAFDYGLISDGALWLDALEKRNLSSHTHDESILDELQDLILHKYFPIMSELKNNIESRL